MSGKRQAFTIVELIIIVTIVAVLAVITMPRLQFATVRRKKADATARKIVTDLRRTRGLAISDAATNTKGFELKMLGGAPYDSYHIQNRDTSEVLQIHQIDSAVSCTGGNKFDFEPLGNLKGGSGTELAVSADGKTFTITIIPATGMIKCTEN